MTATETEQETATAPRREYHCPICGSIGKSLLGPYAHNTCSQQCAIAAVINSALRALGVAVWAVAGCTVDGAMPGVYRMDASVTTPTDR